MLKTKQIKAIAREALVNRYGIVIGAYFVSFFIKFLCAVLTIAAMYAAFGDPESRIVVQVIGRGSDTLRVIRSDPKYSFIAVFLAFVFLFITFVVCAWLDFGRKKLMLELCRRDETKLTELFWSFGKSAHPWRLVAVNFLTRFFTIVPSVLSLLVWMVALATGHYRDVTTSGTAWFNVFTIVSILAELLMIWLSLGMVYADVVILDAPETEIMDAIGKSFQIMRGKKIRFLWTCSISFLFWFAATSIAPVSSFWVMPYVEATIMVFYLNFNGEVKETAAYRRLYVMPAQEAPEVVATVSEATVAEVAEPAVTEAPAAEIPAAEVTEVPEETEAKEGEDHEMPVL